MRMECRRDERRRLADGRASTRDVYFSVARHVRGKVDFDVGGVEARLKLHVGGGQTRIRCRREIRDRRVECRAYLIEDAVGRRLRLRLELISRDRWRKWDSR